MEFVLNSTISKLTMAKVHATVWVALKKEWLMEISSRELSYSKCS
jgi:hypothetical protein